MFSPAPVELNRDAFATGEADSTVDLEAHRGQSGLEDMDLGEEDQAAA